MGSITSNVGEELPKSFLEEALMEVSNNERTCITNVIAVLWRIGILSLSEAQQVVNDMYRNSVT